MKQKNEICEVNKFETGIVNVMSVEHSLYMPRQY